LGKKSLELYQACISLLQQLLTVASFSMLKRIISRPKTSR
jgi:hypothetical protein